MSPFWEKSLVSGRAPLPPGKAKSGAAGGPARAELAVKASMALPCARTVRRLGVRMPTLLLRDGCTLARGGVKAVMHQHISRSRGFPLILLAKNFRACL